MVHKKAKKEINIQILINSGIFVIKIETLNRIKEGHEKLSLRCNKISSEDTNRFLINTNYYSSLISLCHGILFLFNRTF